MKTSIGTMPPKADAETLQLRKELEELYQKLQVKQKLIFQLEMLFGFIL